MIVLLEFLEGEYSSACEGLVFKGGGAMMLKVESLLRNFVVLASLKVLTTIIL